MIQSFDVTIVGGGMVGLALALALKESNLRVAVIERYDIEERIRSTPDFLVSALSRSSEIFLKNINVWSRINHTCLSKYTEVYAWEKDSFASILFESKTLHQPNLGNIVENRVLQKALIEEVREQGEGITLLMKPLRSLTVGKHEAWLAIDGYGIITTKLLVGADGARSWVRRKGNIPLTRWGYGHSALVTKVITEIPHRNIARQIFTPDGPLAFLPMAGNSLCSIVWSTEPTRAKVLFGMSDTQFDKALTAEFDGALGMVRVQNARQIFPLEMCYARDFVRQRVVLIGDAAHTIHPLAGQGVNLGFLDAASLAEQILSLWKSKKDIGSQKHLRYYERWRKSEATKMIIAMQFLKVIFEGSSPVKKFIRRVGMELVQSLPGPREEIMKRALGVAGELPRLATELEENR